MCVIIVKQKDKPLSREVAKTSARINPHGLGIVWLDTFEVTYHKSSEYNLLITERPYIAHFRFATVGKISKSNTHPFVCGQKTDELLMMNGTIQGLGNSQMTDSEALAIGLGNKIPRQHWKRELAKYECRFVSVNTRTRSFQIYNRELFTYRDGVWFSKANVLQDNVIGVYGTLKKDNSNYYNFLRSAKYIGEGETKDKYPLIVDGLPYMVNKKGLGHNVVIDVFKVCDQKLEEIDQLEGHPGWYKREQIPVMVNGKEIICWVYFNPIDISPNHKFLKTYEQSYSLYSWTPKVSTGYKSYRKPVKKVKELRQISLFDECRDDERGTSFNNSKECPKCNAKNLEFDAWSNYYCEGCGDWYTESEV